MEFDFLNQEEEKHNHYEEQFLLLASKTFSYLKLEDKFHLSVLLTNDEFIQKVNKEYRNIDKVTDVISFAFLDNKEDIHDSPIIDLGEIIISIDRAIFQSKEYGYSLDREMNFLFVHGLLHLLGYNHETKEEEEIMFNLQKEILGGRENDRI